VNTGQSYKQERVRLTHFVRMANILLKDEEIATLLFAALPNIYRF